MSIIIQKVIEKLTSIAAYRWGFGWSEERERSNSVQNQAN